MLRVRGANGAAEREPPLKTAGWLAGWWTDWRRPQKGTPEVSGMGEKKIKLKKSPSFQRSRTVCFHSENNIWMDLLWQHASRLEHTMEAELLVRYRVTH